MLYSTSLEKGSSVIDHLPTKSRSSVATDWVHESCIKTLEDLQEINEVEFMYPFF